MADGLGDPIFIFFVVFMVLLFFLLLLKRLYRKPSPLDFQFAALEPTLRNGRQRPLPTISVSVHVHGGERTNRLVASNPQVDNTPPPSFESVVGSDRGKSGSMGYQYPPSHQVDGHENLSYMDNEEPPSYEQYLKLHKESLKATNVDETGRY